MINKAYIQRFLVLLLLAFSITVSAQDAATATDAPATDAAPAAEAADAAPAAGGLDLDAGKNLFINNCAQCHARDMRTNATGPALGGTQERWAPYPEEELYAWIRNSQAMIASGHPRAVELWNQWKPIVMNNFQQLSDQDIANMLGYIDGVYEGTYGVVAAGPVPAGGVQVEERDNTAFFILLAVGLGLLALILARIVSNLNYMVETQDGTASARRRTLLEILTSRGVIGFVIFALVVLGGYTTVNNAIALGRQQGYQPEQPIKFSHQVHSGLQKIECQYCHDGARRSKHSVIPAVNTCMNCHKAIKVGSQYGTAELTKIYAAIGYDPSADRYIEDYDNLPREQIQKIYSQWIANTYVQENTGGDKPISKIAEEAEELAEIQWENIVAALTNEYTGDNSVAGPVEWVRIHNLPDHAYFNHAQHVTVGQLQCQSCHGPVEEMEVVYQHSPLSMGWCINCHRQTRVAGFDNNEYYQSYEKYHEQLQAGDRDKVTVEDIGGLNCQKCHY